MEIKPHQNTLYVRSDRGDWYKVYEDFDGIVKIEKIQKTYL